MPPFGSVPYAGDDSRITDILLRLGDIQARKAEQQGDIWGGAVAGLGQQVGAGLEEHYKQEQAKKQQAAVGQVMTEASQPGFDIAKAMMRYPPELRPAVLETFTKFTNAQAQIDQRKQQAEKHAAEIKKLDAENAATDQYRTAVAADAWLNSMGTPIEGTAKEDLLTIFGQTHPDQVAQLRQMNPQQLKSALTQIRGGSPQFLKEAQEREAKAAEVKRGEADLAIKQAAETRQAAAQKATEAYQKGQLAVDWAKVGEEKKKNELAAAAAKGGSDESINYLLQGGTADKLKDTQRASAVAAAKAQGGIDGTGFVPQSEKQQAKYSDLMDLYKSANRLRELLDDPEVQAAFGPLGGVRKMTQELPGIGQSTKVKEALDLSENLSDTVLRKRSGAAISPGEYQRITGFAVSKTKQPDSNLTNLEHMREEIKHGLNSIGADKLPEPQLQSHVTQVKSALLAQYGGS